MSHVVYTYASILTICHFSQVDTSEINIYSNELIHCAFVCIVATKYAPNGCVHMFEQTV